VELRFHRRVQADLNEILGKYYDISHQLGEDFFAESRGSSVSTKLRAERGRLESYKDDEKIAQAQRDTSAGLGKRHKMIPSLFSNLVWRAQARQSRLEKREIGWWVAVYPGRRPRRPGPGLLSCRPSGAPEATGKTGNAEDLVVVWANRRLYARPDFVWLIVPHAQRGLPEPRRWAKQRRLTVEFFGRILGT